MIVDYQKITPRANGCDWVQVICGEMGGSIPAAIQKMGAALHLSGCEKLIYAIKHLKTPPELGSAKQKAIPYEEYFEPEEEVKEEVKTVVKSKKT